MIHIVIDGYNYISRTGRAGIHGDVHLDGLRRSLLEKLIGYKKQRGIRITVVFDAYNGFSLGRQRESFKGIDVVYSKEGETADDVIIELIRTKKSGMAVVSSDRAIIDEAKRYGVPFITPGRLEEMMIGSYEGKDEYDGGEARQSDKKGNPRRLPKRVRKASRVINKI